jgi:hypothetical protein
LAGERWSKALAAYRARYAGAERSERSRLLTEFCRLTKYHRKYAIALLRRPADERVGGPPRRRGPTYSAAAIGVLERIWEAADYPWSERLQAMLPVWLEWADQHVRGVTPDIKAQLLRMSARQMDRRLAGKKRKLKRKIYGRTKPGTLLKHQVAIKTDNWDVSEPGYCEVDLVSHSGPSASGEFIHSLNLTDIHTSWSETRAIMGKGERGVVAALEDIRRALPFTLKAIDSDNGSEFINHHLVRYCRKHGITFTRGRPYKKDDNAHIEQKNWTHVRRIFGWDRYDTRAQLDTMNALYRGDLRVMMNLFQACVKLRSKERVGSRLRRRYDPASTPLDRLIRSGTKTPALSLLRKRQEATDPFTLAASIQRQLDQLQRLARTLTRVA